MKSIEHVNVSFTEFVDDITTHNHFSMVLAAINISFIIILLGLFLLLKLKKTNKKTLKSHIDLMIHIAGFLIITTGIFIIIQGFKYTHAYKSMYILHQPITGTVTNVKTNMTFSESDIVHFKTKQGQEFKINIKDTFNFPDPLPRSSNYLNANDIAKGDKVQIKPNTKYTCIKDHTFEDDKTNKIKITDGPHHDKEQNKKILIFN